jgi:hypothetical protein
MPRKKSTDVKVNDSGSLESLMQETYNDACLQINDAQRTINELTVLTPQDIEDSTKLVKEKAGLLKIKDSAIRIKLELARLQSDIIKNRGDDDKEHDNQRSGGAASLKDFKTIRDMIKANKKENEEFNSED